MNGELIIVWSMVYGVWRMPQGERTCMVYGVWCMVFGEWCMVYAACMVYCAWCMVYGVWGRVYMVDVGIDVY